jgi:hypothetical protein
MSVLGTQLLIKETKDYVVCLNIEPNDDAPDSFLITPLRYSKKSTAVFKGIKKNQEHFLKPCFQVSSL